MDLERPLPNDLDLQVAPQIHGIEGKAADLVLVVVPEQVGEDLLLNDPFPVVPGAMAPSTQARVDGQFARIVVSPVGGGELPCVVRPVRTPVVGGESPVIVGLAIDQALHRCLEVSRILNPELDLAPLVSPALELRCQADGPRGHPSHVVFDEHPDSLGMNGPRNHLPEGEIHLLISHPDLHLEQFVGPLIGLIKDADLVHDLLPAQVEGKERVFLVPCRPARAPAIEGQLAVEQGGSREGVARLGGERVRKDGDARGQFPQPDIGFPRIDHVVPGRWVGSAIRTSPENLRLGGGPRPNRRIGLVGVGPHEGGNLPLVGQVALDPADILIRERFVVDQNLGHISLPGPAGGPIPRETGGHGRPLGPDGQDGIDVVREVTIETVTVVTVDVKKPVVDVRIGPGSRPDPTGPRAEIVPHVVAKDEALVAALALHDHKDRADRLDPIEGQVVVHAVETQDVKGVHWIDHDARLACRVCLAGVVALGGLVLDQPDRGRNRQELGGRIDALVGMRPGKIAVQAPLVCQVPFDLPDLVVGKGVVEDNELPEFPVPVSAVDVSVSGEGIGGDVAGRPQGNDGQVGGNVLSQAVGLSSVHPQDAVLDVGMGKVVVPEAVVVGVKVIAAGVAEQEAVGSRVAVDHPEYGTDVADWVETVVVPVDPVVGHYRKIVVGLGRKVGATVPCCIVATSRTVRPSGARGGGVVGVQPEDRVQVSQAPRNLGRRISRAFDSVGVYIGGIEPEAQAGDLGRIVVSLPNAGVKGP